MGLIKASVEEVVLGTDRTNIVETGMGRPSVRIQSRSTYNSGLFIVKIKHMPTGCGQWPALWFYGEDAQHPWPKWGEWDITEGVNEQSRARNTIHTADHCRQTVQAGKDFSGTWDAGESVPQATNCFVDTPGQFENQGCSQSGPRGSIGPEFNRNGGGTFAAEWDPRSGHIRTWFWPAGMEPPDLHPTWKTGPSPDLWGTPFSIFRLDPELCSAGHLQNMRLVINLNLCGDLPEAVWEDACPELAAQMTCREYVEGHPEKLSEAYWSIRSIDVFQRDGGSIGPTVMAGDSSPGTAVALKLLVVLAVLIALAFLAGCAILGMVHMQREQLLKEATLLDEMEQQEKQGRERQFQLLAASINEDHHPCSFRGRRGLFGIFARMFGMKNCSTCEVNCDNLDPLGTAPVGPPELNSPRQMMRWEPEAGNYPGRQWS